MFMTSDTTTEIIAHFIGYFHIAIEDLRDRIDHKGFEASPDAIPVLSELNLGSADLDQSFTLGDFNPAVTYRPPQWGLSGEEQFGMPHIKLPGTSWPDEIDTERMPQFKMPMHGQPAPAFIGPEPGSVAAVITQHIALIDNDVVILGQFEGTLVFQSGAGEAIIAMQAVTAEASLVVTQFAPIYTVSDAGAFVTSVAAELGSWGQGDELNGAQIHAVDDISGVYLNGERVEEAPDLEAALPQHLREAIEGEEEQVTGADTLEQGQTVSGDEFLQDNSLSSGGNMLVNEATVFNAGLPAAIIAVQGDYFQIDAIIQTNAYWDIDTIGSGLNGTAAPTVAQNIASFENEVRDATGDAAAANPGTMPGNWIVTVVEGDLLFVEWLEQMIFQSDQDMHVLTATGSSTTVTTGENIGLNSVSFANIGHYYDLVIIGGNLHDANIIVQNNILYDSDTIELLSGASGENTSLSTGGNLLWNQASIHNIGADKFVDHLPDHYEQAMDRLDDGDYRMPEGFRSDNQFEGTGMLRVLYVQGDVYDLRYIKQTNILGDADYVAMQRDAVQQQGGVHWDVKTGDNALINVANIVDYDGLGNTAYVAGDHYSDAILIQADFVASEGGENPGDELVSEVVAFLDNDAADMFLDDTIGHAHMPADGPPADIMQSVLA